MPKALAQKQQKSRHTSLTDQMSGDGKLRAMPKTKAHRVRAAEDDDVLEGGASLGAVVDGKLGKKIISQIAEQQREILEDDGIIEKAVEADEIREKVRNGLDFSHFADDDNEEFELEEEEEQYEYEYDFGGANLSEADRRALEMFLPGTNSRQQTLAELVDQRIREREEQSTRGINPAMRGEVQMKSMVDPKVVSVYQQVGLFLKKYTSGKIPKPFKVIPSLKNWEEILYFTSPEDWSPQATHAATRLFAANLNPHMAQRFFSLVLLPRVLRDIEEHGKLNFHFYESLRRALYKPTAFFKGIILPVAEGGCRARQALIFASVLGKSSIPVLHSSVALLKLSQMPYNGPQTLFMKTLLNKKYALPLPVLHSVTDYFAKFIDDGRDFPLLFYQALLIFVQRYKNQLTVEQKKSLRHLAKKKPHGEITDEIRRELLAATPLDATSVNGNSMTE